MPTGSISALLTALFAWAVLSYISRLRANIAKARSTKLPYIVSPISPTALAWKMTHKLWIPLIRCLPKSWWESWLFIMCHESAYRFLYEPFERLGDTFICASFDENTLFTSDPSLIHQVAMRRDHFVKPLHLYGVLNKFGANVVSTEGPAWRLHRRATAPSFNEKNTAKMFGEAIHQTQNMLARVFPAETSSGTIRTLQDETMMLAFNVIGYVGFGLRFLWPGQDVGAGADLQTAKYGSARPLPGYTMSFRDATSSILDHLITLTVVPDAILGLIPFAWARASNECYTNWQHYVSNFVQDKRADLGNKTAVDQDDAAMDLMGALVRAKHCKCKDGDGAWMDDANIVGNAFIMFLAGHETTATTLHFMIILLATNPAAQRALQRDIDAILGRDTDPSSWDYDVKINAMMASHMGACVSETLRLMPPVTEIRKMVPPGQNQTVEIAGQTHVLPAETGIAFVAAAVQRHPKFWPTLGPSKVTPGKPTDIDDFVPERWYPINTNNSSRPEQKDAAAAADDDEDLDGYAASGTSPALFRPAPGSFIPFSEGPRACLGRRIAMVEMVTALAVIFQRHSVELDVVAWALAGANVDVDGMDDNERKKVYDLASRRCLKMMREDVTSVITLKFVKGLHVPVRFVGRGEEKFVDRVDL